MLRCNNGLTWELNRYGQTDDDDDGRRHTLNPFYLMNQGNSHIMFLQPTCGVCIVAPPEARLSSQLLRPRLNQKVHSNTITSPGYRQFYEFLQVDWATFLSYSLNMECTYFLKARELPC